MTERSEHLKDSDGRLGPMASSYWTHQIQVEFFAQEYLAALAAAKKASGLLRASAPSQEIIEYHFYGALVRAASCDSATTDDRIRHLEALAVHREEINAWAKRCPETVANHAALVGAEIARLECRELDAERLYEEAIRVARNHGFIKNEGIAHELGARFYARRGFETIAMTYLRNARACYRRWGADKKVLQLDQAYPQLQQETYQPSGITGMAAENLDIATVVKITQAVSSEINLEKLIETLMVITLEHARGGDRSLLILSSGETRIKAEATVVDGTIKVNLRDMPISSMALPESVLRYVMRSRETVRLDDAKAVNQFADDEYIRANLTRSIICLPLTKQSELVGVLYVENNRKSYGFTPADTAALTLLASQAAISLENARLYSNLQHAEASLAESQRLTHTGHYNLNVSTGKLSWSEEVYRIFEFDRGTEVTWERVVQRVHPEDRNGIRQFFERTMRDNGEHNFQHRLLMPSGSIKTLHIIARAIECGAGRFSVSGTAMDVTESTRAQELLKASLVETRLAQTRLEEAQRLVRLGTWVWDLSTNKIICSEEHREIFGFTREQLNSTYEFSLNTLHPDDQPRVKNIVESAIREGTTFSCEFRTVLPDGSVRHVHGQGGPSAGGGATRAKEYIGTILDITERKQQEEERQKLVSLIENSSDFIGYSSTTGRIEYVNAGGRRLIGLEPNEALSTFKISDLCVPEEDRWCEDQVLSALLRTGHWEGERVWRHLKTAGPIPVLQTVFYVNDAATGNRIGVATIGRDISERKRVEDALRKSQMELARVARLTTMGEFAGSIAHEVNQPLMAIVTNGAACLQWLSGDKINVEKARQAAGKIVSDGHRAGNVVRSIRELTRKNIPKMIELDINEVIELTLDLIRTELSHHRIILEVNLCLDLHIVRGDRVQLQQVILNIVKNAIEAMESEKRQNILRVVTKADGRGVLQISISDTGVGVDSENADRVFDAFYTTKPEGMGLGLSICRSIVEAHGGRLWTRPNAPGGSVFCITLPTSANRILPDATR